MSNTIIIGAGWAGLSCAYTLAKAGHQITLIEAAPQCGGRARAIQFRQHIVDNGQHLCLGAYRATLRLINQLGLNQQQLFLRLPMEFHTHGTSKLHLKLPNIRAPYNLLWGLLAARNIGWHDKFLALRFCWNLYRIRFCLPQDCSVLQLLHDYGQSPALIQYFWQPIALAAMTTPIATGSAQIFLNTLRLTFATDPHASNWLLPRVDLSRILPSHIEQYLQQQNCQIIYNTAIKSLQFSGAVCELVCSRNQSWRADHVVLAVPPWQAQKFLQLPALAEFSFQPITTIYIECVTPVSLTYPILGLTGTTCQWIFDRAFAGQPNILSAVISGPGPHQTMDNAQLVAQVLTELRLIFADNFQISNTLVVREKRAAFTCDIKIQTLRPNARTPIKNLWLTGDYLQTGLPATLEGAILSGVRTGEEVIKYIASL